MRVVQYIHGDLLGDLREKEARGGGEGRMNPKEGRPGLPMFRMNGSLDCKGGGRRHPSHATRSATGYAPCLRVMTSRSSWCKGDPRARDVRVCNRTKILNASCAVAAVGPSVGYVAGGCGWKPAPYVLGWHPLYGWHRWSRGNQSPGRTL